MKDRSDVYAIDDLIEKTRGIGRMKFANFLQFSFFFLFYMLFQWEWMRNDGKIVTKEFVVRTRRISKCPKVRWILNENVKWNSRWDCENVVRAIVNSLSIPLFPEFVTSIFEPFALDSLVWYSSFFFFFFFYDFIYF